MLSQPISFVDLETTGTSANYSRIIEIGIIKVSGNKIIKKYQTLVNPGTHIDPFIQDLTGITQVDLEKAPSFYDLKDEILEILKDSVFVAHNVRFDYGFMKSEFKRLGIPFAPRHFCTVKLSRLLFPDWKRYNLDTLIEKFNFKVARRHRAYDDAWVLWQFFKKVSKEIESGKFERALGIALKRPTVPLNLTPESLDSLPESPGVYVFYGDSDTPLYIGKSVNIRERVLSHFSMDLVSGKEMKLSREVKSIETFKTAGELGALLLESSMIKKLQPLYNRTLRINRNLIALRKIVTNEGYNSVETVNLREVTVDELEGIIAVFKSEKSLKESLHGLSKEYGLCHKLLNLEKTKKLCFAYHLGICRGACMGRETSLKYNLRFAEAFHKLKIKSWPFNGKIMITEKGDWDEAILVDKWCVLGKVKESENIPHELGGYQFDYDSYRIVLRYLSHGNNIKRIRELGSSFSY